MKIPNIEEAREMLWEEFNHVPDQTIELMIHSYNQIARLLVKKFIHERNL